MGRNTEHIHTDSRGEELEKRATYPEAPEAGDGKKDKKVQVAQEKTEEEVKKVLAQ